MADSNSTVLDFSAKLSESSEAGETFYKLFYEHLDKKRNVSCVRGFFRIHSINNVIYSLYHIFMLMIR